MAENKSLQVYLDDLSKAIDDEEKIEATDMQKAISSIEDLNSKIKKIEFENKTLRSQILEKAKKKNQDDDEDEMKDDDEDAKDEMENDDEMEDDDEDAEDAEAKKNFSKAIIEIENNYDEKEDRLSKSYSPVNATQFIADMFDLQRNHFEQQGQILYTLSQEVKNLQKAVSQIVKTDLKVQPIILKALTNITEQTKTTTSSLPQGFQPSVGALRMRHAALVQEAQKNQEGHILGKSFNSDNSKMGTKTNIQLDKHVLAKAKLLGFIGEADVKFYKSFGRLPEDINLTQDQLAKIR